MTSNKKETFIIQQVSAACNLGWFLAATTETGLCFLALGEDPEELLQRLGKQFPQARISPGGPELSATLKSIAALMDGQTKKISLPLDLRGTEFQQQVWAALTEIPFGSTLTYSELAEHIGRPKSARAVANACGANPVAIVVPCHRVIRSDGSLGGYRGGVERKKILLQREKQP